METKEDKERWIRNYELERMEEKYERTHREIGALFARVDALEKTIKILGWIIFIVVASLVYSKF